MCGIAGIVSQIAIVPSKVQKMIDHLAHRGPDESGVWSGEGCVLGHRRLRIIDLSPRARQPMRDEAGRFVVVFNGEIFNFQALRSELQKKGHTFHSASDTETLLHGFREWGETLPEHLQGMFAFAVWDESCRQLFMARDRYGKKPLFYRLGKESLCFSSELDALLVSEETMPEVSLEGLASYMRFGYVPAGGTVLGGICKLLPGHSLTWCEGHFSTRPFAAPSTPQPDGEPLERLLELLRDAVRTRLVSDVPLGCFLSGGIDSSLIVAIARELTGPDLKTFTVSFPGTSHDEAAFAGEVAGRIGTDHHRLDIAIGDMESAYLETLRKTSEPLGDDSFLPTYFISRATREHVTVALSGDGGDELFGGYPKYRQIAMAPFSHWPARCIPEFVDSSLPDTAAKALELFRLPEPGERALWLSSLWKEDELSQLLADPTSRRAGREGYLAEWRKHSTTSLQDQFSLTDLTTYLEGAILTKVDRASMAASLEVRSPLLDERILDFTVSSGIRNTSLGKKKRALRALLSRYLDMRLFTGPKRGFGLPIDEWFRAGLRPVLEEYTSTSRIRAGGWFNSDYVARIREAHLGGHRNYGRKLHALVAWEVWREQSGC